MDPIWLTPPPGLPVAAAAVARPAEAGEPPGGLAAILAAGGAGAYAWALDGPDDARLLEQDSNLPAHPPDAPLGLQPQPAQFGGPLQ